MRFDILICAVIAVLTLAVPAGAYFSFGAPLKEQVTSTAQSANRYEQLAEDVAEGRIKINVENIPVLMKHQAHSEKQLSTIYSSLYFASGYFVLTMAGIAVLQFSLLLLVLKRKNITSHLTRTPFGTD